MRLDALFRLAFATAPPVAGLTSPQRVTRRLILQEARRQTWLRRAIVLRLLVSIRFQVLLTPLAGVLFTFPSRYSFTIGRYRYLALGGGPPSFPQGFSCPVVLRSSAQRASRRFVYRAITVYGRSFQIVQLQQRFVTLRGVCGPLRQIPATPDP